MKSAPPEQRRQPPRRVLGLAEHHPDHGDRAEPEAQPPDRPVRPGRAPCSCPSAVGVIMPRTRPGRLHHPVREARTRAEPVDPGVHAEHAAPRPAPRTPRRAVASIARQAPIANERHRQQHHRLRLDRPGQAEQHARQHRPRSSGRAAPPPPMRGDQEGHLPGHQHQHRRRRQHHRQQRQRARRLQLGDITQRSRAARARSRPALASSNGARPNGGEDEQRRAADRRTAAGRGTEVLTASGARNGSAGEVVDPVRMDEDLVRRRPHRHEVDAERLVGEQPLTWSQALSARKRAPAAITKTRSQPQALAQLIRTDSLPNDA